MGYIFFNHISNILNWGQKRHIVSIFRIQGYIKLPDHADSNNKAFFYNENEDDQLNILYDYITPIF